MSLLQCTYGLVLVVSVLPYSMKSIEVGMNLNEITLESELSRMLTVEGYPSSWVVKLL